MKTNLRNSPDQDLVQVLLDRLPELAVLVMEDRPENANFRRNPDDPREHFTNWHQFGIVTHTHRVVDVYENEVWDCLGSWGIAAAVERILSNTIDGVSKKELLAISLPLHDLGKFARDIRYVGSGWIPDFDDHEAKSERLILAEGPVRNLLRAHGLAEDQVRYVARCAGLHFELGQMRYEARHSAAGYTLAFVSSERCRLECRRIARRFPEFAPEIGVLFLCDSLAKTDIAIEVQTDEEIEMHTEWIKAEIQERGLDPRLIAAVKQRPVNIAVARTYLEMVFPGQ